MPSTTSLPPRQIRPPAAPRILLAFLAMGAMGCGGLTTTEAPAVTAFSPASGPVATTLSITGTGFSAGVDSVTLGGVTVPSSTGTIASDTLITFPVPEDAVTGVITVNTPGGTASSATMFLVTPVIATLSPTTGAAGTVVTVTGSGLMGITQITVGTATATPTTQTANSISFPVPADAATGVQVITFHINSSYGMTNPLSSFTVTL